MEDPRRPVVPPTCLPQLSLLFLKNVDLYSVTVAVVSGKLKKKQCAGTNSRFFLHLLVRLCVCAIAKPHILATPDLIAKRTQSASSSPSVCEVMDAH